MSNTKLEYTHGLDAESLKESIQYHTEYTLAKNQFTNTPFDRYMALARSVRDRLVERWLRTQDTYYERDVKRVYYLSMEFLMGRSLGNSLLGLGLTEEARNALHDLSSELETLREMEWDAGLGNGGLGRLAACFLDSAATLELPCYGYGIRYEFGIFNQQIRNGYQIENPDAWLRYGYPWEIARPESIFPIHFYGRVIQYKDRSGRIVNEWLDTSEVMAMAYDTPIPGYGHNTVNTLRLWSAKAAREFDFDDFNQGDYIRAVRHKSESETISKVLYPNDSRHSGKELRLKQEYFFASASLQDIIRRYKKTRQTFDDFPDKVAIQLNDTHPAIAIAELMRLLVDIEGLDWEQAWDITVRTFGYTNHTVMPEALEKWSVDLLGSVLPRHLLIIYEINHRFLQSVRSRYPGDEGRCARMSLVEEPGPGSSEKYVRMAHLAIVGSHSINGVSALHSEILKRDIFRDFVEMTPERFNNKTNGITQRRWLRLCNPRLSQLISRQLGEGWVIDLDSLKALVPLANDPEFRHSWRQVKHDNKRDLAELIARETGVAINPESLIDCQIKRIHDYKRQLLNVVHAVALYNEIRENPDGAFVPRTILFGGKAAPGYERAKLTIKLVNSIANVVNNDPHTRDLLKVVFVPNYSVTLAEKIIPGADLSVQISTAGYEASGTGNMKFALNGALTIGTLDGANIEIRDEVGEENIFIFGLTAEQVAALRPHYDPREYYYSDERLRRALDMIGGGFFSPLQRDLFTPIVNFLLNEGDPFMVLADFAAFWECQRHVETAYGDVDKWTRSSVLNVAHIGKFSSDRTIKEYAEDIWNAPPVRIDMPIRVE
jgi:glycogen phosphorylase